LAAALDGMVQRTTRPDSTPRNAYATIVLNLPFGEDLVPHHSFARQDDRVMGFLLAGISNISGHSSCCSLRLAGLFPHGALNSMPLHLTQLVVCSPHVSSSSRHLRQRTGCL
jgi:hypothetical protein